MVQSEPMENLSTIVVDIIGTKEAEFEVQDRTKQ